MAVLDPGRSGRCVNIGNCSNADSRKTITVAPGSDFVCPECGKGLVTVPGGNGRTDVGRQPAWQIIAAGIAIIALLGGGIWWAFISDKHGKKNETDLHEVVAERGASGKPLLRLGGSNTIGDKLGPALAEGWLKSLGCADVKRRSPDKDEFVLSCAIDGKPLSITVSAHGTKTGFAGLKSHSYDLAMASDPIDAAAAADLSALGDMTSPAAEHIIALDGVAVVVNQSNRVPVLTLAQVADLFGGRVTDWSQVGGPVGPVTVFARDDNSGTWKFFKRKLLDAYGLTLRGDARRFEKGSELSDAVATTPGGIGFVGAGSSQVARPVPIVAQAGGDAKLPSRCGISSREYALSRQLFLYLPQRDASTDASRFLAFVDSNAGQKIVEDAGFVPRTIVPGCAAAPSPAAPAPYVDATRGSDKLSTNFFFRTNSSDFENQTLGDLDKVTDYLARNHIAPERALLVGFTDNTGSDEYDIKLSIERARSVAKALRTRGVTVGAVLGFGKKLPIGDNATPEGRDKNRRVEVWTRPG